MTEQIISAEISSVQSGIREDLTSFLLTTVDQQGGFYVLYDAKGEALLHSINLPNEVTTDIRELFSLNKSQQALNNPAHRHMSSEAHGYNISLNEVYFKDEMHLLLLGFPEEKRVNELYNAFPVGVLKVDYEWNLKYCNIHCPHLLGLGEDELHGKQWLNAFDQQSLNKIFNYFSKKHGPHEPLENFRLIVEIITPLGRKRTLSLAVDEQLDLLGHQVSYYILIQDITNEYNESAYLKYLAHHDTLTQLKNRSSLLDAMEVLHEKEKVNESALLFIDLDKFKYINDHYGHSVGDEVLKIVARRLENATRDSDIVARLGGDEFVIILTRVSNEITAYKRASNIVGILNQPALIQEQEIIISTSIGLTMGSSVLKNAAKNNDQPLDHKSFAEAWLNASDSAMYQAKADTANPIIIYSDELSYKMNQFIDTQNAINNLRTRLTTQTYFQPIIKDNCIVSLEALTRFDDPVLRDIQQTFTLISQHKHGKNILWQIIDSNIAAYGQLNQAFSGNTPNININVDMDLMESPTFTEQLNNILANHRIEPAQVYIEITESETSKAIDDNVFQTLDNLKSLGYRISLDDFGTGYSSIERVMRLGFDQIKIDKIFINNNFSVEQKYTALQAAVNLGQALDLELLIEGIETKEDQALAHKCGIYLLQGYFFAKPMPFDDILDYLELEHGQ